MGRRAETQEDESIDKVRKELKSDQMPMCKTISGITFIYQRSRVREKLCKMPLLRNLKCRNFRDFLHQFTCNVRWHLLLDLFFSF